MKKTIVKFLCAVPFLGLASCESSSDINTSTVATLDLQRYAGHWYEIARFDHSFERGLVGCTADYTIMDDGTIQVINSGYKDSFEGKYKQSEGKARRPDASRPGELEVSFFLSFYSPYNVMELASDYSYVLVGSKKDKYLWILSRTPQMKDEDLNFLLRQATARGYNVDELIWVEHQLQ